jgi:MarR family transcriptional regulator, organic hydroperoxide resistance regulator
MGITLETFAEQIQRLTYQLVRYQDLCNRVLLEQHGVTAAQAYTLLAIPSDSSLSMNDLSATMGLASSTMTRTVDQLVLKGLVERLPDHTDRRVIRIQLATSGRETQRAIEAALKAFFEQALAEIPTGERDRVLHSLEQIRQAIANSLAVCCGVPIVRR